MPSEESRSRVVREVIGSGELPSYGRVQEVIVEYENGDRRREIEIVKNGRYVPEFRQIDDE